MDGLLTPGFFRRMAPYDPRLMGVLSSSSKVRALRNEVNSENTFKYVINFRDYLICGTYFDRLHVKVELSMVSRD